MSQVVQDSRKRARARGLPVVAATALLGFTIACSRGAADRPNAARGLNPEQLKAVDIVKNARTISPQVTNLEYIDDRLKRVGTAARVLGWRAQRYDALTYLVVFTYVIPGMQAEGDVYPFPFEVNTDTGRVRYILSDQELSRKYGERWWRAITE